MCTCFTLYVFSDIFCSPSSRKWVFLLSWLFVEWPPTVLQWQTRMTEACWISAASIQELWMSFETSLWIWFKFFRHLLSPVGPLLATDFTLVTPSQIYFISIWHIVYISECYGRWWHFKHLWLELLTKVFVRLNRTSVPCKSNRLRETQHLPL